jgi:hypothetical protein
MSADPQGGSGPSAGSNTGGTGGHSGGGGAGSGAGSGAGTGGRSGSGGRGGAGAGGMMMRDSGMEMPPDAGTDSGDPCSDGRKSNGETGTDCGGPNCDKCPVGQGCIESSDCESDYCSSTSICSMPGCDDGEQNGDETDRDCGGGTCPGCGNGKNCSEPTDCMSGTCENDKCACKPLTTADCGAMECGNKSDGCGGTLMCPMCPDGMNCSGNQCVAAPVCSPATCTNNCILSQRCCTRDGDCGCDIVFVGCR